MRKWLECSSRRDVILVLLALGFIVLVSTSLHVLEPRKIVKWDEVVAEAAATP